jgi:hypothetical protein
VKTRWEQNRLIVETSGGSGPKVSEQMGIDQKQLIVNLILEGRSSSGPITVRRVYDPVTAD